MKYLIFRSICGAIALAFPVIACAQVSKDLIRSIRNSAREGGKSIEEFSSDLNIELDQTPDKLLVPGLFYPDEVVEITDASPCSLPTRLELINWMKEDSQKMDFHGFYWIAPKTREFGFAEYMHLPSMKTVDFGANIFRGRLLMVCEKSDF